MLSTGESNFSFIVWRLSRCWLFDSELDESPQLHQRDPLRIRRHPFPAPPPKSCLSTPRKTQYINIAPSRATNPAPSLSKVPTIPVPHSGTRIPIRGGTSVSSSRFTVFYLVPTVIAGELLPFAGGSDGGVRACEEGEEGC